MNIKKLLSCLMAVAITVSVSSAVVGAKAPVDDSNGFVVHDVDADYTVFYNDFETASDFSSGNFMRYNTQNESYLNSLKINGSGWAALTSSPTTYTWNNKTFNMFNEPVDIGEKYVLSFDAYSVPSDSNVETAFWFAPQHDDLAIKESNIVDYRYLVPFTNDGKWYTYKYQFTASKSTMNMKINTSNSGVTSYVDNVYLTKAAEIKIIDASGSAKIEDLAGTVIDGSDAKSGGSWLPKGGSAELKITTGKISAITEIKMGETSLPISQDGVVSIPKVTGDITITVGISDEIISDLNTIIGNEIYLPYNSSKMSVENKTGIEKTSIIAADADGAPIKADQIIPFGGKVAFSAGNSKTDDYTVRILGDYNKDGKMTVSDIVGSVDYLLNPNSAVNSQILDIDRNDKITVTDIVLSRSAILEANGKTYTPDSSVISSMDSYVERIISQSGVSGITTENLENAVYNYGNRYRIAEVMKKAMRGENITICTFGGSITAGAGEQSSPASGSGINTTFTYTYNYAQWIEKWWSDMFKGYGCNVTLVNAGIGATDTPFATHRMHEDVLPYNPDLVIVEWAMNDGPTYAYKQGTYESMLRKLLDADIAVLMYEFCGSNTSADSQALHEPLSDFYDVPCLSYKNAYASNPKYPYFTSDTVHPNKAGHPLAALTMNYFFENIYKEIETIGSFDSPIPIDVVHPDATKYDGAYIADFEDIIKQKVEGVRVTDMGSFVLDIDKTSFGFRSYYGITARYSTSPKPVVIEIDKCKTAHILLYRSGTNPGSKFDVELNGEKLSSDTYTCMHGSDNAQTEMVYHWATTRLCYYEKGEKVILKITPNISSSYNGSKVQLFSLLLS